MVTRTLRGRDFMLEKYYNKAIEDAINSLKDDGVIIIPTDTIYGLATLASSKIGIERIYSIKNRDKSKLLPIIVNSYKMLNQVADVDIDKVKKLKKYFPGALTIVCKRKETFDYYNCETIAIRMIETPIVNRIIEGVNEPLALTSANISNSANIVDPMDLLDVFDGCVDCAFIEGKLTNQESTIVEIKDEQLVLIREGKIPFDKILKEYEND